MAAFDFDQAALDLGMDTKTLQYHQIIKSDVLFWLGYQTPFIHISGLT